MNRMKVKSCSKEFLDECRDLFDVRWIKNFLRQAHGIIVAIEVEVDYSGWAYIVFKEGDRFRALDVCYGSCSWCDPYEKIFDGDGEDEKSFDWLAEFNKYSKVFSTMKEAIESFGFNHELATREPDECVWLKCADEFSHLFGTE